MDKHSKKSSSLLHYPVLVVFSLFFIGLFALDLITPDRAYSEMENTTLSQRPLQAQRAVQRRWPPHAQHVPHGLWYGDFTLGGNLLFDQAHGEKRRQIVRPDRLHRAGVQHRWRRLGQISLDVVPGARHLVFVEQVFNGSHAISSTGVGEFGRLIVAAHSCVNPTDSQNASVEHSLLRPPPGYCERMPSSHL